MKTRSSMRTDRVSRPGAAQGGFSIIELLVALAMISIFVPAVYSVYTFMSHSLTTQNVTADVQQRVRFGLDFMVQDIRMSGLDPFGSSGATPVGGIEQATATKLRFTSDQNLNGAIDNANQERVTYLLDAANNQLDQILYEGTVAQDTQALIEDVTALTFSYFDENRNPIPPPVIGAANLATIKEIDIILTAQAAAGKEGMVTRTFNARVRGRNL